MSEYDYSGTWFSRYNGFSTSQDKDVTVTHDVIITQDGDHLEVRSRPWSASTLKLSLDVTGWVVTGTWSEITDPNGEYRGQRFHGALQLVMDGGGVLTGRWVGFDPFSSRFNTGEWVLARRG
ncbi:hypothetical protein [Micromonospora peucetia]|uniref:Uncharacterized protein n=1 Tax=Micromonospora peucetia TaxID=47871 RepID=A0A1C6TV79_9ACTN|nr:hypothetical protein [Micromonospora peucetia]SCL45720.1 hypothetical protein GA0070608_0073 [Micromonospora peucetia]